MKKNIIFVSLVDCTYSRSGVYYSGLLKHYSHHKFLKAPDKLLHQIRFFKSIAKEYDVNLYTILIMSPSHKLTLLAKMYTSFKIVLDAGWSLTESSLSRNLIGARKFVIIKNYLIDFISMHSANIVILESQSQINHCKKLFKLPNNKCKKLFTGFNEVLYEKYEDDHLLTNFPELVGIKKNSVVVFFRGKYNSESGLMSIIEAARLLENQSIHFVIATDFKLLPNNLSSNVTIIFRFLTEKEIIYLYKRADICLGQISKMARLKRTIPHKAFEAAFFGKPYLTYDSIGIREFLPYNDLASYINSTKPTDIANKILELSSNEDLMIKLKNNIHKRYLDVSSQEELGKSLMTILD